MNSITTIFGPILGSIVIVFLCALAILWFLLPLYIYQIRNLMKKQTEETYEVRLAVRYLANTLEKQAAQKHTTE